MFIKTLPCAELFVTSLEVDVHVYVFYISTFGLFSKLCDIVRKSI